jgi:hypothetical protein
LWGCGIGLLEGDQAAGELEEGEVVLGLLGPADEDGAVAVQPGVTGFGDPPPGLPVGVETGGPDLSLGISLAAARVAGQAVSGVEAA